MLKLLLFLAMMLIEGCATQPINYATTYACPELDPAQPNCWVRLNDADVQKDFTDRRSAAMDWNQ